MTHLYHITNQGVLSPPMPVSAVISVYRNGSMPASSTVVFHDSGSSCGTLETFYQQEKQYHFRLLGDILSLYRRQLAKTIAFWFLTLAVLSLPLLVILAPYTISLPAQGNLARAVFFISAAIAVPIAFLARNMLGKALQLFRSTYKLGHHLSKLHKDDPLFHSPQSPPALHVN